MAHTLACAVNLRLDSTHRQMEFFRNFVVGVIIQKAHCKQTAIVFGQAVYIVLYLRALLQIYEVFLRRWRHSRRSRESLVYRYILLAAALEVDVGVTRNGIDPLSEGVFG